MSLIDRHMGKILSMLETAVRTISSGNYQESWDMYIRSWLLSFFSDRKRTSYPNGHWVRNSNRTLVHWKPRHFVLVTQQTRNALKSHVISASMCAMLLCIPKLSLSCIGVPHNHLYSSNIVFPDGEKLLGVMDCNWSNSDDWQCVCYGTHQNESITVTS